jgi:type VI secretion system secreted protein VgrG
MTQDVRRCKVTSPLGGDALILTALDAREWVSRPFQYDCRFMSGDEKLDFKQIIGQSVTIELEIAEEGKRYFNGRVARFSQSGADSSGAVYHARIVPWFWFLSRRTDCRIFQGDTVTEILEKVFSGHRKIVDYKKLDPDNDKYDPIPYCVQYRESDFHFASRLMEEWGIAYYFEHSDKSHKLVLFNDPSKIAACPGQEKASCASAEEADKNPGHVTEWHLQQEFRSGAYALTDYNYRDPGLDLGVQTKTRTAVGGNDGYEIFDYPGSYQALGSGDDRVQRCIEGEECASNAVDGKGNCHGFTPGYKFDLVGHVRGSFNTTYLLTEVHHTFSQAVGSGGRGGTNSDYRNSFVCLPHAVPYRPPLLTPKPVIHGAQTATVVGDGKKEIDIDELGCVVVKFHWDRYAAGDATSSCRIRVSEAWGGKNYGAFFAPRIGQEVIVEFLEGDPDQPIITGRVYNGDAMPPYELPGNASMSTLKSNSTKGGGGFNEIRFEDKKGSEQVFVHGQKDLDVRIGNDRREWIGKDRHLIVKNDRIEKVEGGVHLTVGIDHFEETGVAWSVDAGKSIDAKAGTTVALEGGTAVHVKGGTTVVVEAGVQLTLKAGGSFVVIDPTGVTIQGAMVMINSGGAPGIGSGCSPGSPKTPDEAGSAQAGQVDKASAGPTAERKKVEGLKAQPVDHARKDTGYKEGGYKEAGYKEGGYKENGYKEDSYKEDSSKDGNSYKKEMNDPAWSWGTSNSGPAQGGDGAGTGPTADGSTEVGPGKMS